VTEFRIAHGVMMRMTMFVIIALLWFCIKVIRLVVTHNYAKMTAFVPAMVNLIATSKYHYD